MELVHVTENNNRDSGFVFDRGKAADKSYDGLNSISCLLCFRISKDSSFFFYCGKPAGCYGGTLENELETTVTAMF